MKSESICPKCKVVLAFDRARFSTVKCPKCNYQGDVADFKESVSTDIPDQFLEAKIFTPGKLQITQSDAQFLKDEKTFPLSCGTNTLGRWSPNSVCSIQIPVTDTFMSKNHAIIDVIAKANGAYEHRLSDNGSKNGTFHNDDRLEKGDVIKLTSGDVIKLGHTFLKFIAE